MDKRWVGRLVGLVLVLTGGCAGVAEDSVASETEEESAVANPPEAVAWAEALQTNCDSVALDKARQACEKTCPAQVKTYYPTYTASCQPQTNCTYTCVATPPKAPIKAPPRD